MNVFDSEGIPWKTLNIMIKYICVKTGERTAEAAHLSSSQRTGIPWNLEPLDHLLPLVVVGEGGA